MFKVAQPLFFHVITPLHVGSGSDLGIVDLPIQREKHTGFPKIEASSLKGSFRETLEDKYSDVNDRIKVHLVFGLDASNEESEEVKAFFEQKSHTEFAGALGLTDARILLFPVKSMKGIFAWVTCAKVLQRFTIDLNLCHPPIENSNLKFSPQNTTNALCSSREVMISDKIVLEEFTFEAETNEKLKNFAKHLGDILGLPELENKCVLLPDTDFDEFVHLSTEVITRTKINNETGTVQSGALFTEEYLPAESVLYALTFASPIFAADEDIKAIFNANGAPEEEEVMKFFVDSLPPYIQIGGNATIGKGIMAIRVLPKLEE